MRVQKFFSQVLSGKITGAVIIILLFVLAAIYANDLAVYTEQSLFLGGAWGMVLYFLINVLATVFAPFTTFFTIFVAAALWGPFTAASLMVLSWTIGAGIAFFLANHFGKPLVKRMVSLERISFLEKIIPEKHIFFWLILLRIVIPVDILSYGLGLFSSISFPMFISTTFLGVIPFSFIFAYVLVVPFWFSILLVILGLLIFLSGMILIYKKLGYKLGQGKNDQVSEKI